MTPALSLFMKLIAIRVTAFVLYAIWFFVAYLLTLIWRSGILLVEPNGESIEAIVATMLYLAPVDWLIVTVLLLPIILLAFRKWILQSSTATFVYAIAVGIVSGTLMAIPYKSAAWRLMMLTGIF